MSASPLRPRVHLLNTVTAAQGSPSPEFVNSPNALQNQDAFQPGDSLESWAMETHFDSPSQNNALGLIPTDDLTPGNGRSNTVDNATTGHLRCRTGNASFISPRRYQLLSNERQNLKTLVQALQAENSGLRKEMASANEKTSGLERTLKEVDTRLKKAIKDGQDRESSLRDSLKEAQAEIKARITQEEALANRLINVETILAATRYRYSQTCIAGSRENTRANTLFQETSNSKFPEDMYMKAVFKPLKWPLVEINDDHLDSTELALLPA